MRIDAYPHLVAMNPGASGNPAVLVNQQDWGAPALGFSVQVQPALFERIAWGSGAERGLRVGLSTSFSGRTEKNSRMRIRTPQDLGAIWSRDAHTTARRGISTRCCT